MKTTNFSNGDALIFLHHQRAYFPYPLHQYAGGGQIPPPPHFTKSAVAAEYSSHHVLYICRSSKWDSNAESYRTNNKPDVVNIDEESVESMQQLNDNLQDFIDSLWIFKVFRSYGLVLPFIILSMLITTGPKAFLLALALPLGQSTFSYAIQKMQEEKSSSTKPRQKTKTNNNKRSPTRSSGSSDEDNRIRSQGNRNVKNKARQSAGPNVNVSPDFTGNNAASYGGWDELDIGTEHILDSSRSIDQIGGGGSYKRTSQMGESSSSSKMRESDGTTRPLLLRLLIAVFPFLGSWI